MSGVYLSLWVGHKMLPTPASSDMIDALERVEVTHSDDERSGFQLTFRAKRSGLFFNPVDFPLLLKRQLQPFQRVILTVTLNWLPQIVMDGIITDQQLTPESPDQATLIVTGEDISLLMDLDELITEHPALNELCIANKILAGYTLYGVIPEVRPPPVLDYPTPDERIPVQHGTDREYLQDMAARYGYVFYIRPGPGPGMNRAYWGPSLAWGLPQSALTVNMGSDSNVDSLNFRYDGLAPQRVSGRVQDRKLNQGIPFATWATTRLPLTPQPAFYLQSEVRQSWFREVAGLGAAAAAARAQGVTDASTDKVIVAEGELDATAYGHVLEIGRPVGVRGVGYTYDGLYYVRKVTHTIEVGQQPEAGSYRQSFTLTREGTGSITPVVKP